MISSFWQRSSCARCFAAVTLRPFTRLCSLKHKTWLSPVDSWQTHQTTAAFLGLRTTKVFNAVRKATLTGWQRAAVWMVDVVETQRRLQFLSSRIWVFLTSRHAVCVIIRWCPVTQWYWPTAHYTAHHTASLILNTFYVQYLQPALTRQCESRSLGKEPVIMHIKHVPNLLFCSLRGGGRFWHANARPALSWPNA